MKRITSYKYSQEEYKAVVAEIARLVVHAGNMRCTGHGGHPYMIGRVLADIKAAVKESGNETV